MFRNRKHKLNNQQGHHKTGSSTVVCTCPRCGYSIPHIAGIPCKSHICPTCMVLLVRGESSKERTLTITEKQTISSQIISTPNFPVTPVFPVVDADLCIGCEACIKNCPANAILLVDGKAVIQNELCKNCRKCVRVCPAGAIH